MRIGLIADILERVPPELYGGVERVVSLLVHGLVARGHEVTLFASDDSVVPTPARLVPFGHRRAMKRTDSVTALLRLYSQLIPRAASFDVIHSLARTAYLLPVLPLPVPKVQTYQSPVSLRVVRTANRLAHGTLTFTACSKAMAPAARSVGTWENIYNGVEIDQYDFSPRPSPDGYLAFLGRLDRIKGVHTAIEVARAAGKRLIIAGNVAPEGENRRYFDDILKPQIDGDRVQYIGPVDNVQKNRLLGGAEGFLFPIEWEEPFGIVLIEAMACGTPPIAFRRGAVPEIVTGGVDGFICVTPDEMVAAVANVTRINRAACRQTVERRFSADAITADYERLYARLIAERQGVYARG